MEQEIFRTSVRNMVEFLFRSGSIDNRRSGAREKSAMDAGSRIHRKIQRSMKGTYESEVTLRYSTPWKDFLISVEGRADGIFTEKLSEIVFPDGQMTLPVFGDSAEERLFSQWEEETSMEDWMYSNIKDELHFIDEIKGVYREVKRMDHPVPVHKAQAMCYAFIYAVQHELPAMGVQMTYCNLETEDIKRFRDFYTLKQLTSWFVHIMEEYGVWAEFYVNQQRDMRSSLQGLEFPFPYRPGQRRLAVTVYRSIEQQGELFVQAPTGIGKTMSVLFPSLQSMGQGMADRVFYLTAKTVVRTVAEEAFDILRRKGLSIHSVTITAKEKICLMEECVCNPEHCPYADGHFDRVNAALYDLLTHEQAMKKDTIQAYAKKHQVCPFEFNLDLCLWAQGIICDYNYVFDPNVYLRRFFGDAVSGKYLFLVDEAHNLPDRAREMFSAMIVKEEVLAAARCLEALQDSVGKDTPDALRAAGKAAGELRRLNKVLLAFKKETDGLMRCDASQMDRIYAETVKVQDKISAYMEETKILTPEELLNFYFGLRHFNAMYEIIDDDYISYCCIHEERFEVHLLCANPARNLTACCERAVSSVFFSATLLPVLYYKELLTIRKDSYAIYVDSPFDTGKRLLAISEDVSSLYKMRGPVQYNRVFSYICRISACRKGNYLVFFPSYQYMLSVAEIAIAAKEAGKLPFDMLIQQPDMDEEERLAFLAQFAEVDPERSPENALVGFCVIGGIFSEGIDLIGRRLIGAIVIGTGLAQRNQESNLIMEYFNERGKNGFDYAYRYPGLNKVFQAAGRVIRSREDEGVIFLLDKRLMAEDHVKLFPMDWADYRITNEADVLSLTQNFWEERRRVDYEPDA